MRGRNKSVANAHVVLPLLDDLWLHATGTARGIMSVRLAADDAATANSTPPWRSLLADWVGAWCAGETTTAMLPPLAPTTGFAVRVRRALLAIPHGEVVTYGTLAHRLGIPGGARAVGRAVGANPLAVLVPCHRVVRAGGGLGGYSAAGGTAVKARLLAHEGAWPRSASPTSG